MTVYLESSAALSWLLGEEAGESVIGLLSRADRVVSSQLTLLECERALGRAAAEGRLTEVDVADRRAVLRAAACRWDVMQLGEDLLRRARDPFPAEPVPTLDAIHLACAVTVRSALPGLRVLSLDRRVRASAHGLGFEVLPA